MEVGDVVRVRYRPANPELGYGSHVVLEWAGGSKGDVVADAVSFQNPGVTTNDFDGDGLSDAWERYYFLSLTAAQPGEDMDGDERSNFTEFMTGTDPTDAGSRFDMRSALRTTPGQIALNWASVAGRTYAVEVSEDLVNFTPVATGLAATPPQNTHEVPAPHGRLFYRVTLEPVAP